MLSRTAKESIKTALAVTLAYAIALAVNDDYRDMWIGTAGVKYHYAAERAVSLGVLYASSPTTDGRRNIALPFDRVISVGAGVEQPCFGFICHVNVSYVDLSDGDVSEDGGPLLGSIDGSFSTNWAVALDVMHQEGMRMPASDIKSIVQLMFAAAAGTVPNVRADATPTKSPGRDDVTV